jgi:hypothetical protein
MMPDLSQTIIVIIVVAIAISIAILLLGTALIMMRRLKKFSVKAGGIAGSAEAGTAGAGVLRNKVEGRGNTISGDGRWLNAKGFNAPRLGKDDDPT